MAWGLHKGLLTEQVAKAQTIFCFAQKSRDAGQQVPNLGFHVSQRRETLPQLTLGCLSKY